MLTALVAKPLVEKGGMDAGQRQDTFSGSTFQLPSSNFWTVVLADELRPTRRRINSGRVAFYFRHQLNGRTRYGPFV